MNIIATDDGDVHVWGGASLDSGLQATIPSGPTLIMDSVSSADRFAIDGRAGCAVSEDKLFC